jgi:RNA polymerase sigma-70 factor (ECF subfamily)
MSFPSQMDELELHERVLQGDRVASADVFQAFMDPILRILKEEMSCSPDDARDSATDAVFSYLRNPGRYDRHRARLSTYLTQAAKKRAMDRHRSTAARLRREQDFASVVEVQARTPKEVLEVSVEAKLAAKLLDDSRLDEREWEFLRLVLQGEGSTRRLAGVLGLDELPEDEMRREVKRHRDRLMKLLERLGKEGSDDEP